MTSTTCRVCLSRRAEPFAHVGGRDYWRCPRCAATFLDDSQLPDRQTEHERYLLHENDPQDERYRSFLNRLASPLLQRLPPVRRGLDYGCGPGPALGRMLTEAGHAVRFYDPFFRPDDSALRQTYDFITCSEVVEHFHRPAREFAWLNTRLKTGGCLGIMTCFQTDDERFADWHYRRDPTHVVFYRPQTFRHLAALFGWRCEIPANNVVLIHKTGALVDTTTQTSGERVMAMLFEELDYQSTTFGDLVLRRRTSPAVPDEIIYEVTIDGEMLMSSTVNASERALARLALEGRDDRPMDVLVGGLGLGCTAAAALEYPNVRKMVVVELLAPVIAWHRQRMVPLADTLIDDPRCVLVAGDFFEHVAQKPSGQTYDAVLLDIDHAPECLLDEANGEFYSTVGLRRLARCLRPGGVFALWSAWKPQDEFLDRLGAVFPNVRNHEVSFFNPHVNEQDSNWIIVAKRAE